MKRNAPKVNRLQLHQKAKKLSQEKGIPLAFALRDVRLLGDGGPQRDYDYETAKKYGIKPDETGHWQSRVPQTGIILKSENHPTFGKTIDGERQAGYMVYRNLQDKRIYSFPEGQVPDLNIYQPYPIAPKMLLNGGPGDPPETKPLPTEDEEVLATMPKVKYGSPEYRAAYNSGNVVVPVIEDGQLTLNGIELPEVTVTANYATGLPIKQREDHTSNFMSKLGSGVNSSFAKDINLDAGRDLYRYFGGLPTEQDGITYSHYQPSKSKDKDAKYIALRDPNFKRQILEKAIQLNSGIFDNGEKLIEDGKWQASAYTSKYTKDATSMALGDYQISLGSDKRGRYIAYYDIFDRAQGSDNDNSLLTGTKPFEIYDRIYEDEFPEEFKRFDAKDYVPTFWWKNNSKSREPGTFRYGGYTNPTVEIGDGGPGDPPPDESKKPVFGGYRQGNTVYIEDPDELEWRLQRHSDSTSANRKYGGHINSSSNYVDSSVRMLFNGGPVDPPKPETTTETETTTDESVLTEEQKSMYSNDEAYKNVDDFIIDFSSPEISKLKSEFARINRQAGSCLRGAKFCNQEFVAPKVGATSISDLFNNIHKLPKTPSYDPKTPQGVQASQTKYSVPSSEKKRSGVYKDTPGFDAWEAGQALVGEGLGTYMYRTSVNSADWQETSPEAKGMTKDFYENYVKTGKIPLGAIIFEGNAAGVWTDPKYGEKPRHSMTVVGFDKADGVPLVYDSGNIRRITNRSWNMPITSVVIPKGYENYTLENLKAGQKYRYESLGFSSIPEEVQYKKDETLKPYINDIKRGVQKYAYKIANDYDVNKNLIDKFESRLIGIAAKESNFGNRGEEDLNALRELKIFTEGYAQDALKQFVKFGKDVFNIEKEGPSYTSWDVEMIAYKDLVSKGINPFELTERTDDDGNPLNKLQVEMIALRKSGKYPKPSADLDQPDTENEYDSSVGPFSIKTHPNYVEEKLGIKKSDLYGTNVDDDVELERGAATALVLLVENYKKYAEKFKHLNLTEDELIDIATIAYNANGVLNKENTEDFIKYYIQDKVLDFGYLRDVKNFEKKYNNSDANSFKYGGHFNPLVRMLFNGGPVNNPYAYI